MHSPEHVAWILRLQVELSFSDFQLILLFVIGPLINWGLASVIDSARLVKHTKCIITERDRNILVYGGMKTYW